MSQTLDRASEARLSALFSAPLDRWIALSADETRVLADADTFQNVTDAVERAGESDPVILRVPTDWTPRVLLGTRDAR